MNITPMTTEEKIARIKVNIADCMFTLGLDLTNPSLKDTPNRVAKMWVNEWFSGLDPSKEPKCTTFPNENGKENEIVILKGVKIFSTCEHHLAPFFGNVSIGYIPNKEIIGISKLARIAKYLARRPQVQERLTQQIVDYVEEKVKPHGVICVITGGVHTCITSRGVESTHSEMITSAVSGLFLKNRDLEHKFFTMIGSS